MSPNTKQMIQRKTWVDTLADAIEVAVQAGVDPNEAEFEVIDNYGTPVVMLCYPTLETDAEFEGRMQAKAQRAMYREVEERGLLVKLKAKYEGAK